MLYLGIDIAKAKLDCLLLDPATHKRKSKSVANSAEGIGVLLHTLQAWGVEPAEVHIVMEPTSSYHELAALALHDSGCTVSLLNPAKLRRYAQSIGALSKTDAADAAVLARYGAAERPQAWQPPSPGARALRALLARRDAVAEDLQRERNRAEKTAVTDTPEAVRRSLQATLSFLEQQLQVLQQEISQHIDQNPDLHDKRALLLTIPGVGERVAQHMTALLTAHRFQSAAELAAYLGLVPVEWQSGSSIKGKPRLSKEVAWFVRTESAAL